MISVFVETILPLFSVIMLGYILKRKGFIGEDWIKPANRITYYVAIPAVLFKSVAEQEITKILSSSIIISVGGPLLLLTLTSGVIATLFRLESNARATFIHSSLHGNIGYMAYAVSYYALGEKSFHSVVVISSILIIAQNIIGVIVLTANQQSVSMRRIFRLIAGSVLVNPIIVAVFSGILLSFAGWKLPPACARFVKILADMGLPTGLLLIGAGLAFGEMKHFWKELTAIGVLKLFILPLMGFVVALLIAIPQEFFLPLMILLSSPTATVTYVMATQLGGHPELASSAVSTQTLLCALSYCVVISVFGG